MSPAISPKATAGCGGLRWNGPTTWCGSAELAPPTPKARPYGLKINAEGVPVVVEFVVHKDAMVWPMVAAGTSNDEIQAAKGIRPLFDDPEEGHA